MYLFILDLNFYVARLEWVRTNVNVNFRAPLVSGESRNLQLTYESGPGYIIFGGTVVSHGICQSRPTSHVYAREGSSIPMSWSINSQSISGVDVRGVSDFLSV